MVENDPIDDLLKNKMQERSFSPGPNDWREMEALLEQHMPVKTKKRWFWIPVFFCVASIVVIYRPTSQAPVVAPDNAQVVQNNSSQSLGLTETAVTKNTDRGITEQNLSARTLAKPVPNTANPTSAKVPAPLSPGKADITNKNNTNDKTTSAIKPASATPVTPYRKRSAANKKEDNRNYTVSQNNTAPTTLPATTAPPLFTTTNKETEKPLPDTAIAKGKNEDPIIFPKITDNTNTPPANPIEQIVTKTEPDTSAVLKDSTSLQTAGVVQDSSANPTKNGTNNKFSLAISAGFQGWNSLKKRNHTFGVANLPLLPVFSLGLQATWRLNHDWSVSGGAQYALHSKLEHMRYIYVKNYSYGSNIDGYWFLTRTLNNLQVPVEVQYHVGKKSTLLAAMQTDFLLNANQKMGQLTPVAVLDSSIVNNNPYNIRTTSGYTTGFRMVSWSMALGYGINLNNHWFLSTRFQYGLTDYTINKYFTNRDIHRNTGIQIIIRYNIIRY
ncbi:MAG: PorT family protein [Bacteroidia bacterium]|nr:PorT family protein [Bacteroidia bacterium]